MTKRNFTIRGVRNGSLVHVTWTEGTLKGDPPTVDLLYTEAEVLDRLREDARGARAYLKLLRQTIADPLSDPISSYYLVSHVFDNIRETTGNVPEVQEISTSAKLRL